MGWPPRAGEPLPRATACWYEQAKLEDRVSVWEAIAAGAAGARIATVRDRGANGIVCGVEVELAIGGRSAPVTISWHYADENCAPRLATAYPTP